MASTGSCVGSTIKKITLPLFLCTFCQRDGSASQCHGHVMVSSRNFFGEGRVVQDRRYSIGRSIRSCLFGSMIGISNHLQMIGERIGLPIHAWHHRSNHFIHLPISEMGIKIYLDLTKILTISIKIQQNRAQYCSS